MKKTIEVHVKGECYDVPSFMRIDLTPERIRRILVLSETVKTVEADYISEFDYAPVYLDETKKVMDRVVDVPMCKVSKDDVHWTGLIRHTDLPWESDTISLGRLKRGR